jgi:hypothetical protein
LVPFRSWIQGIAMDDLAHGGQDLRHPIAIDVDGTVDRVVRLVPAIQFSGALPPISYRLQRANSPMSVPPVAYAGGCAGTERERDDRIG